MSWTKKIKAYGVTSGETSVGMMNKLRIWYLGLNFDVKLIIAAIVVVVALFQIYATGQIPIMNTVSLLLLILAFKYTNYEYSFQIFVVGMGFFVFSSWFTMIIPLMILVYFIYVVLSNHRLKRLLKLANSTPDEIAGIKKSGVNDENTIDIIIRTGGKK